MKQYFIIECKKAKRQQILSDLFELLISNGYTLYIVKTRLNILDLLFNNDIKLFGNITYQIYEIDKMHSVAKGVKYLASVFSWHKPIFHLIVGNSRLPKVIRTVKKQYCINKLENLLSDNIVGYIEPLDGDLYVSGNNSLKDIVKTRFPENMQ